MTGPAKKTPNRVTADDFVVVPTTLTVAADGEVDGENFMFPPDAIHICQRCNGVGKVPIPDSDKLRNCKLCKGAGAMLPAATWPLGEMAKFFFARSANWVRLHERCGDISLWDPKTEREVPIEAHRKPSTNARYYTLYDVERLAHAMASHGVLESRQLKLALRMLALQGKLHGYSTSPTKEAVNVRSHARLSAVGAGPPPD